MRETRGRNLICALSLVTKTQGADGIMRPALRHTERCQISHPADVIIGRDTQVRENRQWAVWLGQKHRGASQKVICISFNCFAFSRHDRKKGFDQMISGGLGKQHG